MRIYLTRSDLIVLLNRAMTGDDTPIKLGNEPRPVVYVSERQLLSLLFSLERSIETKTAPQPLVKDGTTRTEYVCTTPVELIPSENRHDVSCTVFAVRDSLYYASHEPGATYSKNFMFRDDTY